MEILPSIDLCGGAVVRLAQGDFQRQTHYDVDPQRLAAQYRAAGARWLHVVDLDGARSGELRNLSIVAALVRSGLSIQVGGGVRSESDLHTLFDAGASRVVLGSVAVRDPELVERWLQTFGPERLCLALDTRFVDGAWTLPSAGWLRSEPARLDELAPCYAAAGAMHLLSTDIDRDGMLAGPSIELYRWLRELVPAMRIQASGGVRDRSDVVALGAIGINAVILGRSLLEGRVELAEALAC